MENIKTELELFIEFRNNIALRTIECKSSIAYWKEIFNISKKDEQERVDALNNISLNERNLKKDKIYLKVIDTLLEEIINGNN